MKCINTSRQTALRLIILSVVASATIVQLGAQAIVPINGPAPTVTSVTINANSGDQTDPHVSGDWAAYNDGANIVVYNFVANVNAQIPKDALDFDSLSDVSGSKIVFSRTTGPNNAVMVFDAATPSVPPIEIDPATVTTRLGSAIGGNTVAYVDYGLQENGELVVHDLTTSTSVRMTSDAALDLNPSVSADGSVVSWEHCPTSQTNCDIWKAVRSNGIWTPGIVSDTPNPEGNPDTNGTSVVYDSTSNVTGEVDIFWKPVTGGAETHLQLAGTQLNPSIADHFISFESRGINATDSFDLFVYDRVRNLLYQITNTPLVNERLNDLTVLPDGRLRAVWASDEDGFFTHNVKAATFTLPLAPPSPSDLIQQLVNTVATFNLRDGIVNSLDAKLANAQAALDSVKHGNYSNACGMLGAFISEVQAQSGKAITMAQAAQLIDLANQARAGLGCS